MLSSLSVLTALNIGVFYPLCLLIHLNPPIKGRFHRFHLGMPLIIGGVASIFLLTGRIDPFLKGLLSAWFLFLAAVIFFSWKKEYPSQIMIFFPFLPGLWAFFQIQSHFSGPLFFEKGLMGILGALILCESLHSMMLGHHYLNVRGLPIGHLRRAVYLFWGLLGLRLLWDIFLLAFGQAVTQGGETPLLLFLLSLDGFLLWIGILFGTLFPFITLFFVKEILKVRNTQSATGVLYAVLCAVLMGDLTYKYYALKYGVWL